MGVIYGSHQALRQFRSQGRGVLINMGSVNSRIPMPYYSTYVASKHAILGLDGALSQELRVNGERDIHVVTIMPWATDTPWFDHAANYSGRSPRQRMMDSPDVVLDAVVQAAIRPRRQIAPGWKAKTILFSHRMAPSAVEAVAAGVVQQTQMRDAPAGVPPHSGTLHQPDPNGVGVSGGVRERMRREDEARAD
jgi:short-subunit dehydrogenase